MFSNFFNNKILFPTIFCLNTNSNLSICFIFHMIVWGRMNPLPNEGNCLFVHLISLQIRNIFGFGFFTLKSIWQIFDGEKTSIMDFHITQFELLSFTMDFEFPSIYVPFKSKSSHKLALIPPIGILKGKSTCIDYNDSSIF